MLTARSHGGRRTRKRNHNRTAYAFLLPFFALFATFFLLPTITSLLLAFFRWNGLGTPDWVGVANFQRATDDPVFWAAARNTVFYSTASVLLFVPMSLMFASLLNAKSLRLKSIWRSIYITPVVVSAVATSLVFQIILNQDAGLLNGLLGMVGVDPIPWLQSRAWVKLAVVLVAAWGNVGLLTIYFLAGLQAIPGELYEASVTEGAGPVQQFRYITLPLLKPVLVFVLVLVTLNAVQLFDEPQILTQGGPANASLTAMQYLYSRGFERLRFGFASSVAALLFGVVVCAALVELRFGRGFDGGEK